jgi:CIC family chloride channel protein
MDSWYTPAVGGLICGILGCLAFWLTSSAGNAQHGVFSIGYGSLEAAFENQLVLSILITLLAFKFVAVVVNYASGGSGGLFSPTLFLGGILGGVVGVLLVKSNHYFDILTITNESQIIGGCVLLGMGAMFGSVLRCPFTSLIIIFELTGNYSLILPLMGGNMLSWAISRKFRPISLYDALLLDDGVSLKRMPLYRGAQDYRNLPVAAIMTHDVFSVKSWLTAAENLTEIHGNMTRHHAYTVIDEEGKFIGVVSHLDLKEVSRDTQVLELVRDQDVIYVHPEASIRDASHLMIQNDIQQLPILSASDKDRLLGILTLNDIARQQNATQI